MALHGTKECQACCQRMPSLEDAHLCVLAGGGKELGVLARQHGLGCLRQQTERPSILPNLAPQAVAEPPALPIVHTARPWERRGRRYGRARGSGRLPWLRRRQAARPLPPRSRAQPARILATETNKAERASDSHATHAGRWRAELAESWAASYSPAGGRPWLP